MQDIMDNLCCPETHQPLTAANPDLLSRLNTRIKAGQTINRGGKRVDEAISGGYVREDGKFLYPIRGKIPVMLIDEAIPLST